MTVRAGVTALVFVCGRVASAADDSSSTEAALAYDRAIASYAAGDKPAALEAMRTAYQLSHHPDLLYNLGKLARELDQCQPALQYYRAYTRDAPNGAFVHAARQAIAELEVKCAPAADTARYWTTARIVGWSAIGAGVAAEAGALALQLSAHSDSRDAQHFAQTPSGDWDTTGYPAAQSAEHKQAWAIALGITGGVFITGGVLCLTWLSTPSERERPNVALAIQPGRAYVGYSSSF